MSVPYLERKTIPNSVFEISDENIEISTPALILVRISKPFLIGMEKCNANLKELKSVCKENNIKLMGANKIVKQNREGEHEAAIKAKEAVVLFEKAVFIAREVEQRGLHYGYLDDEVLRLLQGLQVKIDKLCGAVGHRDTEITTRNNSNAMFLKYIKSLTFEEYITLRLA